MIVYKGFKAHYLGLGQWRVWRSRGVYVDISGRLADIIEIINIVSK